MRLWLDEGLCGEGVPMPDHFVLEKEGRITTLTFNRPEKRNPLNEEIVLELEGLLQQVRDDKDARVMIFTGSGNTFSAGAAFRRSRASPMRRSASGSSASTG